MSCRLINSPLTGEKVQSQTWNDLYELSGQNEQETDKLYEQLLSSDFLNQFGNWVTSKEKLPNTNSLGEPIITNSTLDFIFNQNQSQENLYIPENLVKYRLKAVELLNSPKAEQLFKSLAKNNVTGDTFWKKVQELGIPKEQIELLKSFDTYDREELITNMLANYSYTIEINTTTEKAQQTNFPSTGTFINEFETDDFTYTNVSGIYSKRAKRDIIDIKPDIETNSEGEIADFLKTYYNLPNFGKAAQSEEDFKKSNEILDKIGRYEDGKFLLKNPESKTIKRGQRIEISKQEFKNERNNSINKPIHTKYYHNLTVPGGTNYTENEIATPAIMPSIKGHAQFATDRGIGWFRSDEQVIGGTVKVKTKDYTAYLYGDDSQAYLQTEDGGKTKTRRILEVQSDLFQKGRDRELLVESKTQNKNGVGSIPYTTTGKYAGLLDKIRNKANEVLGKTSTERPNGQTIELEGNTYYTMNGMWYLKEKEFTKENQFLQLLNKDNNWVRFFVKAIIQDSAKKGYEKVLFPAGDTAAKVEGHPTIERFIEIKETRLRDLEYDLVNKLYASEDDEYIPTKGSLENEIKQLEREIEYAKAGKLKISAIANFYENTIHNILKKQGYNPKRITDEYNNDWYEVPLNTNLKSDNIYLSSSKTLQSSKASEVTLEFVEEFLKRIGVDIKELSREEMKEGLRSLENYDGKSIAYGIADMVQNIAWILKGKSDVALTEEAMHFAVSIIKSKNPSLYKEMFNAAGSYKITNDVINNSQYRKMYTNKETGKPDILKLKEEAIGKILAEYVIKGIEGETEKPELIAKAQSWWTKILNWFQKMFTKTHMDIENNPFEKVAKSIQEETFEGTAKDIKKPVSRETLKKLENQLVNGFLADFGVSVSEYNSFKEELGIDGYSAADLVTKAIAYEKGQTILPHVAYFAYSILGKQNNKIKSELRYLIGKWDKYKQRFDYHRKKIYEKEGFIENEIWKNKIKDLVIIDFLAEKIIQQYENPKDFEKSLDTKWTREDFSLWNKIKSWFEDLLSSYSSKYQSRIKKLDNLSRAIADEILTRKYEYFEYSKSEDQIRKYYNQTIQQDPFAKELVRFGQENLNIVLTGSLALRKAGTVYRTVEESLHDIDWVVPFNIVEKDADTLRKIKSYQGTDPIASAALATSFVEDFSWFVEFKKKYPSIKLINSFYGQEHNKYESLTVQSVINGEFYESSGTHEEKISYYIKDKTNNNKPKKETKIIKVKHKKGDWKKDTGYVIDFFIRLAPQQEEHENYFKLWKEIMIAKLKMGRDKDFIDWKAFSPYLKSKDSFNFNYAGFRHINYEDSSFLLDDSSGLMFSMINEKDIDTQASVYNRIKDTRNVVELIGDEYIRKSDGKKVALRVSQIKEERKRGSRPERTREQKEYDDQSAAFGTKGHADIEDIAHRYIDDNGYVRLNSSGLPEPLPQTNISQLSPDNPEFYNLLEENFRERLALLTDNFTKKTRFLMEQVIYDPNFRKTGLAGTMDFVAIHENGSVDIYDWKFMENTDKKTHDIISQKKEDFNIQLSEYKRILKDAYGIDKVAKTRAIPIIIKYFSDSGIKTPRSISISPVDVTKAEFDFQLPYAIESERTGNEAIDKQIDRLQALYKKVKSTSAKEIKNFIKNEQLNQILKTIRHLQIKQDIEPLLRYVELLDKETKDIVDSWNNEFKGKEPLDFTDEQISLFAGRILDAVDKYHPFRDILKLKEIYSDPDFAYRIDKVNSKIQENAGREGILNDILKNFINDFLAKREDISDFLAAEREYKGLRASFRGASQGGTTGIDLFYNITSQYLAKIRVEQNLELQAYEKIAKNYKEWAKSKGYTSANMFDILFEKSPREDGFNNRLIDTIDKKFFEEFEKAKANKDFDWISKNIDLERYKEEATDFLNQKIDEIKSFPYDPDPIKNEEEQGRRIQYMRDKFNFNSETSFGYYDHMATKYPTQNWYSDRYKELTKQGNEPALELFKYIKEKNKEAADLGMITRRQERKFLPFLRKEGILEKIEYNTGVGKGISLTQPIVDMLTVQEDDYGYGYRDPVSGEVVYDLRPRYTSDFLLSRPQDLSTDLLNNMREFSNEIIRYKNLSTIYDQVKGILEVEKLKNSIQTNASGKVLMEGEEVQLQENNTVNYKAAYDFFLLNFLGLNNVSGDLLNKRVAKIPEKWQKTFDAINDKFPINILPTDIEGKEISVAKLIEAARRYFQTSILGFNIGIPFSNTLGGAAQLIVNSGDYYTTKEAYYYDTQVAALAFSGKKDMVAVELVKILEPYVDIFEHDKKKKVSASKIGNFDFIRDIGMYPYRSSRIVEIKHALAMFHNAIVIDGNVVNVNQYLNKKYSDQFTSIPYKERKELQVKIEEEKKELLKEKGLINNTQIVDNKLVMPEGVTFTSPSLLKYRNVTVNLAKQALGAATQDDKNRMAGNSLLKSFLLFKTWLPPLLEPRISELKFSQGTNRWEYGRYRAFAKAILHAGFWNLSKYNDLLTMNDNGVELMGKMLEEQKAKYLKDKGKELKITTDEYARVYQTALKNQTKDVIFTLSLIGILVAASQYLDDNEDPETKSYSTFALRMLNKLGEEFTFYYNPVSILGIVNGNIMPPLSLVYDVKQLLTNIIEQGYGFIVQDDEIMESAKPLKYSLRLSPLTRNLLYYSAVISPELKKALDIRITSQSRSSN